MSLLLSGFSFPTCPVGSKLADSLGFFGSSVSAPRNWVALPHPCTCNPAAYCQPGITVTVGNGVESVVSDAIVVLERCDVLWAEVMFPAAEISALEDPCREWRGHQLNRVLSTTHQLCPPEVGSGDLVLTPVLTQMPWVASGQSRSLCGTLTVLKLRESTQAQTLLATSSARQPAQGSSTMEMSS